MSVNILLVWRLLSTFVSFPCSQETFRQLRQIFVLPGHLPSTLPTFGAARRPSINFRHLSLWPENHPSTSVRFLCCRETFSKLPYTLHETRIPSVKFLCSRKIFRQFPATFRVASRPRVRDRARDKFGKFTKFDGSSHRCTEI